MKPCDHKNITTINLKVGISSGRLKVRGKIIMKYEAFIDEVLCKDCNRTLYLDKHDNKMWLGQNDNDNTPN